MRRIFPVYTALLPYFCCAQENEVPIFVGPLNEVPGKQSQSEKKYSQSYEVIDNPASGNINQETVPSLNIPGSFPSPKSFSDLVDRITSAQVEHYGGEAGALHLRLRGARAFEPSYYFNGFPLVGAGSGEQNNALLPISHMGLLQVYPDSPPFWLSSMGISGDIDIQSCRRKDCFSYGKNNNLHKFNVSQRFGSYGYQQTTAKYSLKLNPLSEIFSSVEYTRSRENYPVFNNNNSSLNSDIGFYEPLQNNDFKKQGGGISYSYFYEPIGKFNFDFIYGSQDKGLPGVIGSISYARLKRNLLLGALRSEKLFPKNGITWNNQIGAMYNTSQTQNFTDGFASQANRSVNYSIQLKSWTLIPSEIISKEKTGFVFEILQSHQNTNTSVPASNSPEFNSNVSVSRSDLRPALFQSILFPFSDQFALSANVNAWISFSQGNANIACNYPSIQSNCSSKFQEQEEPIYGYTFSIQSKFDTFIPFARYSLSMRRPYLSEFYGAPGGTLPNLNLLPESSRKVETGLRIPWLEIGYFHAEDSNLIFLQQISSTTAQYQNIESGYRNGVYLNSDYYILKYWKASLAYQYLMARMIQNGEESDVPRSARHYVNASTNMEDLKFGEILGYQALLGSYVNMNWQSSFYLDYANINEMSIPPIYNSGISVTLASEKKSQNFIIAFDIYNVSNETYATVSNSTEFVQQMQTNGYIGYPPPGRRYYISIIGEI
ncbi:hypothetical protein [Silvanigrella aquatica]|uniref:TonB-dependent receptor plug domain-containing protein n=1 Tax=Silvanigrella aquatica TaxID=1915309 RepID=A0A1L4CYE7_9BACT|nr:hypothetical protein [Silvanigrella aquatica]APJ02955.1 hypothetical protein AXG55_03105 [Silvanigrella aquatica]